MQPGEQAPPGRAARRPVRRRTATLTFWTVAWCSFASAALGLAQRGLRNEPPPQATEPPDPTSLLPEQRTRLTERVPIFFPPIVPPIDRSVANAVVQPGQWPAPPELAAYVNELFYPVLSTRLHTNTLYEKLRSRLTQYRAAKLALQNELRAELGRQREAEPAARRQALAELARRQTPRIAELEREAEQLRKDFTTGNYGWSAFRLWHLSDREKRGFSPLEIALVMRGYAYYQSGLLTAQRRLLLEIVVDLIGAVDDPAKAASAPSFVFFSPDPARVQLPDDLSAEVSAKLAAYQTKKSRLKKELYDAIQAHDGSTLGALRNPLKALADRQAGTFAELELLADDIRRGLANDAVLSRPPERSPLPGELADRVGALLRDRATAQREATAKSDAIGARDYGEVRIRIAYRFDNEGMNVLAVPMRNPRRPPTKDEEEILAKVRAELAQVAEEYGRRIAEIFNRQDEIRRDAGDYLHETRREKVDAALLTANRIALQKETEEAYRDYRTAVFEPGLSPEQRRLLFDSAIEQLNLPLPRGEIQITGRSESW